MADIPASALLGQFAEEITPAGQAVLGLKAQPFTDNHGAALGDIHDAGRGNVSIMPGAAARHPTDHPKARFRAPAYMPDLSLIHI